MTGYQREFDIFLYLRVLCHVQTLNIHKKVSDRSTILVLILNLNMQILIQAEGDLKVIVQSRIAPPTVFSQHK